MALLRGLAAPLLSLVLAASWLPGADAAASDRPVRYRLDARGGMRLDIAARQPLATRWSDGVDGRCEGMLLRCDAIEAAQSPAGATTLLATCRLLPGPSGPLPDRIELDTRQATLPQVGLRARLTPASATLTRVAIRPAPSPEGQGPSDAPRAEYLLVLASLGDWEGEIRISGAWTPVSGWADRAEIAWSAAVLDGGLGMPRVDRITLHGADGGRLAELQRRPATGAVERGRAPAFVATFDPADGSARIEGVPYILAEGEEPRPGR